MDTSYAMAMEQEVRKVSSVVDDHVLALEKLQVADGAEPFAGVRGQIEIDGQPGMELVEATQQALRIVGGLAGSAVAASEQLPGQIELGAIDGK